MALPSGLAAKIAAQAAAAHAADSTAMVAPSPLESTLLRTGSGKMQLLAGPHTCAVPSSA